MAKTITIPGGRTYPSHRAAARDLGVSPSRITQAKRRGRLAFIGRGRATMCKPCMVDGRQYPTITAAMLSEGLSGEAIRAVLTGGAPGCGYLDFEVMS